MNIQLSNTYSENGLLRSIDIFNHPREYSIETTLLSFSFILQYGKYNKRLSPSNKQIEDRLKFILINI